MKSIIWSCIGITTFLAFHTSAEESKNFDIKLTGKNGIPFQMTFIYCPPGETFLDPEIKSRSPLKGFHIGDFKVTTSQLIALMGPDAIKGLKDFLAKDKHGNYSSLKDSIGNSSIFPAVAIIPEDAVKFCFVLQNQYSDLKTNQKDTYEGLVFKIPSHEQWVYAARGSKTPETSENSHFAFWFTEEELLNENKNIHNDLKEIWKDKFPSEIFKFDQNQIIKLYRAPLNDNGSEKNKLEAFLAWMIPKITDNKKLTGTPLRFEMLNQSEAKPNRWGFKGMHDLSCEWVMSEKERNSFWKTLEKDFIFENTKWKLSGIRYGANLTFDIKRGIDSFAVWSGPKLEFDYKSDEYEINEDFPSFRVVAEKGLVPDWLYFLARDVLLESNQQMAKNKIKEIYTYIESLGDNKNYLATFESLINIHNFKADFSQLEPVMKSWSYFSKLNPDKGFPDKDFFDLLAKASAN